MNKIIDCDYSLSTVKFTEIKHKPTRLQVTAITAEVLHTHTHTHRHKLCYKIQCARTARAIQRNPVSKTKIK